ncbi:response regulator transcription factor [Pseudomonas lopnurensis]|uniref:response regulator transcription factor n=1 Tax=Pseudomonas lopnurensis TaxID=1477517 RepID=UPI0028ADB5F6|nr:response regulator transcription factor [Pseudomonas lopnurensis]
MLDIILLEDEPILREELTDFLGNCGYPVESVATLAEFRSCFDSTRHRIAIIDLGLPDGDGLDLIRELRANEQPPGIVVLSARKSTRDKVLGLGDGADYYLGKGTDLDELAATLAALNRRLEPSSATKPWVLETGPRRLHLPDGIRMPLSQQDFLVLHALMCESGELVSRQRIVAALGKDFLNYDQRCLDTQMRRLRRKIAAAGGLELPVKTARNAGYRFYAEARVVD